MKLLIDTHYFIWSLFEPDRLSTRVKKALRTEEQVFISTITLWEIALKVGIGKVTLPKTKPVELIALAEKSGFEIRQPLPETYASYNDLPLGAHRDPFDRLLVWQAICEKYTVVTIDDSFSEYRKAGLKIF